MDSEKEIQATGKHKQVKDVQQKRKNKKKQNNSIENENTNSSAL